MTAGSNRKQPEASKPSAATLPAGSPASDLLHRIAERCEHARRCGALEPIETESETLADEGVHFVLRIASSLDRKQTAAAERRAGANPFLPYDEDLYVTDLGEHHVCLLNKFMVLENHALIVTRAFEEQESLLTPSDFQALLRCLDAIDGLGFYNAGKAAGASQPHKHLQLVPTPLGEGHQRVPIEELLPLAELATLPARVTRAAKLPFRNALIRVDDCMALRAERRSASIHERYESLLEAMDCGSAPLQPYNLLVTRQWMLLVPRTRDSSHGIEVNALGIAGAVFARSAEQLRLLKAIGPMQLLRDVTLARE